MFLGLRSPTTRVCPILLAWTLSIPFSAMAGDPVRPGHPRLPIEDYVPDEVLVLATSDTNRNGKLDAGERLDGIERAIAGTVARRTSVGKDRSIYRVKLPPGKSVQAAIAEKWGAADARIVAVEPNYRVHILTTPDDSRYPEMWSLNN